MISVGTLIHTTEMPLNRFQSQLKKTTWLSVIVGVFSIIFLTITPPYLQASTAVSFPIQLRILSWIPPKTTLFLNEISYKPQLEVSLVNLEHDVTLDRLGQIVFSDQGVLIGGSGYLTDNKISFTLPRYQVIQIEYEIITSETSNGFDEPSGMVLIDGRPTAVLDKHETHATIHLQSSNSSEIIDPNSMTVTIQAGNSVDLTNAPTLLVKNLRLRSDITQELDLISFQTDKLNTTTYFSLSDSIDATQFTESIQVNTLFALGNNQFFFYSIDELFNFETMHQIQQEMISPSPLFNIELERAWTDEYILKFQSHGLTNVEIELITQDSVLSPEFDQDEEAYWPSTSHVHAVGFRIDSDQVRTLNKDGIYSEWVELELPE